MGDKTGIAWTEKTWNPWYGCTKVSAGCDLCYMFREQTRYGNDPTVVKRSKTKFNDPLRWKEPSLVFTCSWSDWFHKDADAWRDEAWGIVRRTPHLTYQILTKRPGRIARHLPADWGDGYPNVWLGTSIEDQRVTYRATQLIRTPAKVHFISMEPLLGPVLLPRHAVRDIEWVIVGGESGDGHREMKLGWVRAIQRDCERNGIPVFLKQLGGWPNPKAGAEAVLDGKTYTEFPHV